MSEQINEANKPKDLDLLNKMKKLPGGLVIIPLVLAVLIATFFPQAYQIGGYVTALFYEGNSCMMGFFLIVCGSAINIKQVGMPLYKGVKVPSGRCHRFCHQRSVRTGRIPWDRSIRMDRNHHQLQRIPVHLPVCSVW